MHSIVRFFLKFLMLDLRGGKVLKDLLVRAKVQGKKQTDGKSRSCQRKRCEICNFLEARNTFTNKKGSVIYKIREGLHLDCNSENVIYLISCKKCQKTVSRKLYY